MGETIILAKPLLIVSSTFHYNTCRLQKANSACHSSHKKPHGILPCILDNKTHQMSEDTLKNILYHVSS